MRIERLTLQNFRNYTAQEVTFHPGVNVIYGGNAQGKTNLIEALYYFAFGKSFRTTQDKELIRFGEDATHITVTFADRSREQTIDAVVRRDRKKQVRVNGVNLSRLGELVGRLGVVLFYPEELSLVKEGPSHRRRFLDIAISQARPNYYHLLSRYQKTLEQRNTLLKKIKLRGYSADTMPVWNEKLAEYGWGLIQYRREYVARLAEYARAVHAELSGETLAVSYRSKLESQVDFLEKLSSNLSKELEQGATLYGPHRDDLDLLINDLDAKVYASQGQQRTCVLSLKIAQADFMGDMLGEYPVLLLDDIMSELDLSRRRFLLEKIRDKQVIVTCTDGELISGVGGKRFYVQNGTVTEQ